MRSRSTPGAGQPPGVRRTAAAQPPRNHRPGRQTVNIGLGAEMEQYLRSTYRRTFEKLDREGKIDEATYVLAELLKCGSEAVDYLERKGRIKQAAQLAETVELAPEIAVRLWCMEGNITRAVQLARLGQAFAAAVQLLEKKRSAQDGRTAAAVGPGSGRARPAGGSGGGHLAAAGPSGAGAGLAAGRRAGRRRAGTAFLLRKLLLLPGSLADSEAAILHLLDDDSEQARSSGFAPPRSCWPCRRRRRPSGGWRRNWGARW